MTGARTPLWIGTYPDAGAGSPVGQGEGVWSVDLDPATGELVDARLVVATPSPSFLALHPSGRVLYTTEEHADGRVGAFAVDDDGGLTLLARVPSGGDDPCHALVSPDGRTLYVANYSSGTLAVLPLDGDGRPADEPAQVLAGAGGGPDERQDGPHAHFVTRTPDGRHLLAVDLGTDELRRYRVRPDGLLDEDGVAVRFAPGTGPRHLAWSADGASAYVVGELDVTVQVVAWDPATATGEVVQVLPVTDAPAVDEGRRPGTSGRRLPAHVLLDGDRLVVGVRTADVLTTLVVGPDGRVRHERDVPLPGSWPRHHEVVDGRLLVAQQLHGGLVALAPDGTVTGRADVPVPTCVLPARG